MTETHHDRGLPASSPNGEAQASGTPLRSETESPAVHGSDVPRAAGHRRMPDWRWLTLTKAGLAVLSLVIVLIGAGAGYLGALLWPPEYAARAEILYEINTEKSTGFLREDRSLTTQLVLLRGRQVLGPVAATDGLPVEEFQKQVTVALVDSSEVVQVEVRADSREAAVRRTKAIIDGYLRIASTKATSEVDSYVHAQLTDVQKHLTDVRAQVERQRVLEPSGAGNASARSSAEAALQSLTDREQQLLSQRDELNITQLGDSRPEVVVPAYAVDEPVSPRPLFAAATGALTALVLAAGVVALLAHRRTRG